MAQPNYTPIQLYSSSTATNTPSAANLAAGELAINTADGILFYKDSSNVVQKIGYKLTPTTAGGTGLTSFTANGVVYASSTSALATGSALTFDGSKLLVSSSGEQFKLLSSGDFTSTGSGYIRWYDSVGSKGYLGYIGTANTMQLSTGGSGFNLNLQATGSIIFEASAAERMRLTSTSLYTASGINVGIGTSSPAYKLVVAGTAPRIVSQDTTSNYITVLRGGNTIGYVGTESNIPFAIVTNSNTAATFDTSGNLGIGGASTGSRLYVTATNPTATFKATTTGYPYAAFVNDGGDFYVGRDNSAGGAFGYAYSNVIWGTGAYSTVFATNNQLRMTLDANGNLGLGTSSPSTYVGANGQLVVYGAVGTTFTNNPTNVALVNNGTIAAGLGCGINFAMNYNGSIVTTYGAISCIRETATSGNEAGTLVFGTRTFGGGVNMEKMRLDSSGNLGIGTTSPSYRLHAVSSAAVVSRIGSSGGSGAFINFIDSGASPSVAPSVGAIGNNLVFMGDGSSSERARIDSSGNLLVGATSSSGLVGNNAYIVGGNFSTVNGANTITASATTVTTLPTRDGATYLFSCQNISDSGTPSSYGATSIISQEGSALAATAIQTGTFTTIGVSGLNIQITSSLGSKVYKWSLVRIM